MAKQIKVIKCPNCGSIQKTEIKPDHYRCNNCQTEYFLDSDDININVNHQTETPKNNFFTNNSAMLKLTCAAIIVFCSVTAIKVIFKSPPPKPPSREAINNMQKGASSSSANTNQQPSKPKAAVATEQKYRTNYKYCSTIIRDNKAYVLSLEDHTNLNTYSADAHKLLFTIYDLVANKKIKEQPIENVSTDKYGTTTWEHLDFTDDKTYFVANNNNAYLLDKVNYKLSNITASLLEHHPDYQTGLASISLSQTTSGNAFHILTNDGKKLYYYPLIDEVYLDDYAFQMVEHRPKKPPADTNTHLAFSFAHRYSENIKLIKYEFISPDGKNHLEARSAHAGDNKLGNSPGKHTDEDSAYDLINKSNLDVKVVSQQNLTPSRLYFDPSVIYFDQNTLIIKAKVNAAPDADYHYQQLDENNGKVIWTLPEASFAAKEILPFNNSFIAKKDCNQYAMISSDGKITQKITLNDE